MFGSDGASYECDWTLFCVSVALAGGAGIRATLPAFLLSAANIIDPYLYRLSEQGQWLAYEEVCLLLGLLFILEIVGDQIPALDHMLHVVLVPAHPIMGAAVAIAPAYCGGWFTRVPMAIIGAALALSVHACKAAVRAGSSGVSCGMLNPVVSLCETLAAFALLVFSILHPIIALGVSALVIFLGCLGVRWSKNIAGPPTEEEDDEESCSRRHHRVPQSDRETCPPRHHHGRHYHHVNGARPDGGHTKKGPSANQAFQGAVNGQDRHDGIRHGQGRGEFHQLLTDVQREHSVPAEERGSAHANPELHEEATFEIERILSAPNPHAVLAGNTASERRSEFRRLVRLLHPDKGLVSGDRANLALRRVVEAERSLS